MKGYFNQNEQCNHLIAMSAMIAVKNLLESNAVSEIEKKELKNIIKSMDLFSESVYRRLGDSYKRQLINKAKLNTLRLTSRFTANESKMEDRLDNDMLCELVDMTSVDCINCNRTDCLDCQIYKMKVYLNYNGQSQDNDLCPFRKEENIGNFDFIGEEL